MTKNNYVVYHLHTEQSLLDSCTNYKDYVDRAVELGQKAIAFTEHGNVLINGTSYPLQHLFQMYEFLDGTPVGVEE